MNDDVIPFPANPKDRRPSCVVEDVDRARAAKLKKFSRAHGWSPLASPSRWVEPLAVLRRNLGDAHPKIDVVLAWYVEWYDKSKRPTVRDGAEFRARFDWLCQIYDKEELLKPRPVSPEAQFVLEAVRVLGWPAKADVQLPAVIEQSLVNLRAFYRRAKASSESQLWGDILDAVVGSSYEGYLTEWFRGVWKRYHRWAGWDQDVGRCVWRPGHPDFVKQATMDDGTDIARLLITLGS